MGCACKQSLRIAPHRHHRVLGLARNVDEGRALDGCDAVFCQHPTPDGWQRLGRAWLVCACETGWTRVGGSTGVIYGPATPALVEAFRAVQTPLVVCALYEGEDPDHPVVEQIRQLAAAEDRSLEVVPFGEPAVVRTHPLAADRFQVERCG